MPLRNCKLAMEKEVYISYSWSEPSKSIVLNWLCECLDMNKIFYKIDKKNCNYREDISEFEKKIGRAQHIILLVCNSYFYSENCMYEAAYIIQNGKYKERIYMINMGDFPRNSNVFFTHILQYWKERKVNYKKNQIFDKSKIQKIKLILKQIKVFFTYINECNTLTFFDITKNNFKILIEELTGKKVYDGSVLNKANLLDNDLPKLF